MKAFIEHESRGRLRVRMKQYRMTLEQADLLEAYLQNQPGVLNAAVHERTAVLSSATSVTARISSARSLSLTILHRLLRR